MTPYSAIGPIATFLPSQVEDNDYLQSLYPKWNLSMIEEKTGIRRRHVATAEECASDLGVAAAKRLFADHAVDPHSIDFLLFCTQAPDYPLPTTACLMQERLGLRTTCGAVDMNLGCSGFVYGLALADGLIRAGTCRRVLLVTADTYSKYIDPDDRSLRTIFGDGAAATLVEASPIPSLSHFAFGTDGRGAGTLIVNSGGARPAETAIQPTKRQRWASRLYMDGPELVRFVLEEIPKTVTTVLTSAGLQKADMDFFLLHQATRMMLEQLHPVMGVEEATCPIELADQGNTVSSTIPILIDQLRRQKRLRLGHRTMLLGFGVGLSWGGCLWTETWEARQEDNLPSVRSKAA